MTATQVLFEASTLGIVLEARGSRLHVEAPAGAISPALREALAEHKPALLALLSPEAPKVVSLKGGLALPVAALLLALDLEVRGFTLSVDQDAQIRITPAAKLTDADRDGIRRWRLHLGAIAAYRCEVV